jgi:hypothetical protein
MEFSTVFYEVQAIAAIIAYRGRGGAPNKWDSTVGSPCATCARKDFHPSREAGRSSRLDVGSIVPFTALSGINDTVPTIGVRRIIRATELAEAFELRLSR